ncbi:E3 ubiquitin-protein ligase rififylin [Heracleum sosnowskyi]|uniref:E3 ubiquitin-protein ligase rififylin n=1 Tax=Heracleum sosnowskyi TaxID=360622 RepID=A0AAD8I3W3_9APIA|nr:E3 ubiquitin-protein ligase rififylin [Heracleum sosnowskyi]
MDAPNDQPESSSTLSPELDVMEVSGHASTSSSVSQARQEDEEGEEEEEENNAELEAVRDETFSCSVSETTCSCICLLSTIWFLVSVTLMLGLYGSSTLRLGPNCSLRIRANPLFVEYVRVKQFDGTKQGPTLYGFSKYPPLDVLVASSAHERMYLPERSQKDWIYFLNEGSQMNISMTVMSSSSLPLELAIGEGIEGLTQWLDNPMYPNNILSSDIIHGNGTIHHSVTRSSNYYVSIINLNSEIVEMQLNLTLKALVYNTTRAYYNCSVAYGECTFRTSFSDGNTVVLTTPGSRQGVYYDDWYVELSYGPRWMTYTVGLGGMAVLIFLAFRLMNCCRHIDTRPETQYRGIGSERAPLLSHKDDDQSSCSSSCDFVFQDDEQVLDMLDGQFKDGETDLSISRLCAICFDAPRDCFFLPCGHCVACLACGMRIKETSETCPICRRKMKKVRKLIIV